MGAELVVFDIQVASGQSDDGGDGWVGDALREDFLADVACCACDDYLHFGWGSCKMMMKRWLGEECQTGCDEAVPVMSLKPVISVVDHTQRWSSAGAP